MLTFQITNMKFINCAITLYVAITLLGCNKSSQKLKIIENSSVSNAEIDILRTRFNNEWDSKFSKICDIDTSNTIIIKYLGRFRSVPKYCFFIKENKIFFILQDEYSEIIQSKCVFFIKKTKFTNIIDKLNNHLITDKTNDIYDGAGLYISEYFDNKKNICYIKEPQSELILKYLLTILQVYCPPTDASL